MSASATERTAPAHRAGSGRAADFRPELEGLRAVAILLVAASHLWWGRISGGIDVFLVVSGYLITITLVRRWIRTGRVGAGRYLSRLATRLLPAAAAVFTAVLVFAEQLAAAGREELAFGVLRDLGFAAAFAENWYLAETTDGYLAEDRVFNPVEHFWALSMQVQFYLAWLVLVLLVVLVTRGTRQSERTRLRWAVGAIAVVTAASLAWSMAETLLDQPRAYLDTAARIWEFGAGGLLALLGSRLVPGRVLGSVLGWLGLAMIVGLGFLGDFSALFPGFASLWPVAGTALVVLGANARAFGAELLLGSRVAVWLGGLSFGLYLWHWPLISGLAILAGVRDFDLATGLGVVAAALAASWIMKALVERPVQRAVEGTRRGHAIAAVSGLVVVGAIAAVSLAAVAAAEARDVPRAAGAPVGGARVPVDPGAFADEDRVAEAISAALAADGPVEVDAVPGPDARVERFRAGSSCLDATPEEYAGCLLGPPSAPYRAVVLGDSNALSWHPAVERALGPEWRVQLLTGGECAAATLVLRQSANEERCPGTRESALAEVERTRPDLVILTSSSASLGRLASGATGEEAEREWRAGLAETLERVGDAAGAVAVVAPAPPGERSCSPGQLAEGGGPCASRLTTAWETVSRAERAATAGAGAGAAYLDTRAWFCADDGRCPWAVDGTLVRADRTHLTQRYAERLAPVLRSALLGSGLELPPLARPAAPAP